VLGLSGEEDCLFSMARPADGTIIRVHFFRGGVVKVLKSIAGGTLTRAAEGLLDYYRDILFGQRMLWLAVRSVGPEGSEQ
jgi:hypothetical protein